MAAGLFDFELEPEVVGWLDGLGDADFKRVDEVCGLLAEHGAGLGGQHEQAQIDRAVRAQALCQAEHHVAVAHRYERKA